jgi:hypothetical protein
MSDSFDEDRDENDDGDGDTQNQEQDGSHGDLHVIRGVSGHRRVCHLGYTPRVAAPPGVGPPEGSTPRAKATKRGGG